MVTPEQNEAIKRIETEALQAEQRGDWGEALELYERIRSRGLAQAHHLTLIGNCLIRLRRRKDASDVLMQAFELDPNYQPCIDLLNKYLPGWEKRAARSQQSGIGDSSRSGSGAVDANGISVEAVSNYRPPPQPQAPPPSRSSATAPPPPPPMEDTGAAQFSVSAETSQTPRPRPKAEPSSPSTQPMMQYRAPEPAPPRTYDPAAGSSQVDSNDPFVGNKVYWPYVMQDAEEEMGISSAVKLAIDEDEGDGIAGFAEEEEDRKSGSYSVDDF